jgi:hypothetical protein
LGKFDLQLTFPAARVLRKYIQNQLRAVDDAALRGRFDISLLHRRKVAVKDNQWRFVSVGFRANFIQFAAANECCGIRGLAQLKDRAGNFSAGASRQLNQFR